MSSKNKIPRRALKKNHAWLLWLASPLVVSRVVAAPNVIANPGLGPAPQPAVAQQDAINNEMNVFVPNGTAIDKSLPQPFQYGEFTVRPHLDYSVSYGDGIQTAPTNQQETAIQQITPGISLDYGTHWTLDYAPTIRFYSSSQFKDGVDESFSLAGRTHYEDWAFGLSQTFLYTTAPTAETAAQTEQQTFSTALTASDVLNDKLSLDLGLNQDFNYADNFQNSKDWSATVGLNYIFWPRLTAGMSTTLQYVNEDIGPDQTSEQLNANLSWRATDKISFVLSGGFEDLQYADSSISDTLTPVFSGAIQYHPVKDTQIALNASRSISPSIIPGSDTTSTSFGLSVSQKLFKKFNLDLGAGYGISKYTEVIPLIEQLSPSEYRFFLYNFHRTDDTYTFSARLSHPFYKRGTWSVFYSYSDNQSSQNGFSYTSNQVGFEISYRY